MGESDGWNRVIAAIRVRYSKNSASEAGVTLAQATADVDAVSASLEKTYPKQMLTIAPSLAGGLSAFGDGARAFVSD